MCWEKRGSPGVCRRRIWSICSRRTRVGSVIQYPHIERTKVLTSALLVTEGIDGIEVGGFVSRVGAENDANNGANHQADDDPIEGDHGRKLQKVSGGVS